MRAGKGRRSEPGPTVVPGGPTIGDLTGDASRSPAAEAARQDEARIAAFRELVHRLRSEADLTQAELAARMGTTQSAIARMEGGGTRPTLDTLERLAAAVGADLVVGVGADAAWRSS